MKDITDVFSEVIDKYIDFYMTKEEFNRAWKKVTKEMSHRYKKTWQRTFANRKKKLTTV